MADCLDRAGTKLAVTREAAHSRYRILHAHGDSTGREISRALLARAHSIPHLHLRAHAFTTELIVEYKHVVGVRFLDEMGGSVHEVHAGAVLLATGGVGRIYRETTNPDVATGDGMAIAYDAGTVLSDIEFNREFPQWCDPPPPEDAAADDEAAADDVEDVPPE